MHGVNQSYERVGKEIKHTQTNIPLLGATKLNSLVLCAFSLIMTLPNMDVLGLAYAV